MHVIFVTTPTEQACSSARCWMPTKTVTAEVQTGVVCAAANNARKVARVTTNPISTCDVCCHEPNFNLRRLICSRHHTHLLLPRSDHPCRHVIFSQIMQYLEIPGYRHVLISITCLAPSPTNGCAHKPRPQTPSSFSLVRGVRTSGGDLLPCFESTHGDSIKTTESSTPSKFFISRQCSHGSFGYLGRICQQSKQNCVEDTELASWE